MLWTLIVSIIAIAEYGVNVAITCKQLLSLTLMYLTHTAIELVIYKAYKQAHWLCVVQKLLCCVLL